MPHVEIFTVDRLGDNWYSHPEAYQTEPIRETLNEPGSFACAIPNTDPNVGNAKEHARELQIWRNGHLRWQGKITGKDYDPQLNVWNVRAEGPLCYFKGLGVGRARQNWLTNGSFDTGDLTGWSAVGTTANVVTNWGALPGTTHQANLYQAGAGTDTFIQQGVTVPGGTNWTLAAWFHIRTDSEWVGPALDGRGLYVERRHPDTNEVEDVQFFAITDDTERGIFQRATVNMWSPPGRDSIFWIRLYATRCTAAAGSPPGSIIWDAVQLVGPESLSYTHQDLGVVVNGLVAHGQDPDFGNTDLHITPGAATSTGIFLDRYYQFDEHANIYDELMALAESGLCDIQCVTSWNASEDRSDRHIRAWVPRQGETKNIAFELDAASGVSELQSIEMDGSKTKTTFIAVGDGSGPDREEAYVSDTSLTDGVVIKEVYQASGTHHDLLPAVAAQQVALYKGVSKVPAMVLSPDLTDLVNVGDVFPTLLDIGGPLIVNGNYRVVQTELDLFTDQLTVQVVEV